MSTEGQAATEIPDDGGLVVTQQLERTRECRDDLLHAFFM